MKSIIPALPLLMLAFGTAQAAPITLLSQQSVWNYNVTSTNLFHTAPTWGSYDFSTFGTVYTGTSTGMAGFGNATPPAGGATNTGWAENTDLALQITVNVSDVLIGNVMLNLASDNGAIVFVNGIEVFRQIAEGYTSIWEYTSSFSSALLNAGNNTISVLAEDHGGATFFDMELIGVVNVPEPGMVSLFSLGLLGFGLARRRQAA